uniref:VWFA domain-containing protein n=1 Tax=Parascaris equorum TaxID=6256 RepID=A0A914RU25_PAREQ
MSSLRKSTKFLPAMPLPAALELTGKSRDMVETDAIDLVLLLDKSASMVDDFDSAKKFVEELVKSAPPGDYKSRIRVALVTFNDNAHLVLLHFFAEGCRIFLRFYSYLCDIPQISLALDYGNIHYGFMF